MPKELSARQKEVFDMYNKGVRQVEIAKTLKCSPQNVNIILKIIKQNETKNVKTKNGIKILCRTTQNLKKN